MVDDIEIEPELLPALLEDEYYFCYDVCGGRLRILNKFIENVSFKVHFYILSFIKSLKQRVANKKNSIKLYKQRVELCFSSKVVSVEASFLVSITFGTDSINQAHAYTYLKTNYRNPIYNIVVHSSR